MAKRTTTSAAKTAKGGAVLTLDALRSTPDLGMRVYTATKLRRSLTWQSKIENPDEVLKQFGAWEGLAFYFRMMRQFAFLGGPINQRIDPVVAIERQIVAGDPDDPASVEMMKAARKWWADVPHKEIVERKLLMSQFIGFAPIEKVFGIHSSTGLIAPVELYDLPAQNVFFDKDHKPLIRTETNWQGIPVPDRKLMFMTWGSNWTPYGEGELKDVYLATWYMQTILDFGMEALEQLGRPIPLALIPRGMKKEERADFVRALTDQFRFVLTAPTDDVKPSIEFAGQAAAAGGNAGRSENEWLRYIENWIYVRLLNTAQTQDRGGSGNGKLEEQRSQLKSDKTTQASAALDECLTAGLLHDIGELNWSNQPRELWPRFRSNVEDVKSGGLTGVQLQQVANTMIQLAAKQITAIVAEKILISAGIARSEAAEMVQSTEKERAELVTTPATAAAAPVRNDEVQEAA